MYNTLTGALQKIISRSNQSINIMPLPILPARVRKSANSTGEPKKSNVSKKVQEVKEVKSPYFSPRRLRSKKLPVKIEYDNDQEKTEKNSGCTTGAMKVPGPSPPKKVKKEKEITSNVNKESDEVIAKWEPLKWRETLDNLRQMRKETEAPVDTMGCHKCSDETSDEKTQRYHILVALMLSSQTKDQVTYDAMNRLKERGLTPEKIVETDLPTLEKLLVPVSFYRVKAKNVQKTAKILIDEYNSDIPDTLNGLLKLPGIGPKMAHICMHSAWNIVTGIGVDTHVHRISNRLKWVKTVTKEPEKTRVALESWVPFELWNEVNELLVGLGQTICTPTNPKCDKCLNASICPSRVRK